MKKQPEGTGLYPHTDDKSTQARHHSYLGANGAFQIQCWPKRNILWLGKVYSVFYEGTEKFVCKLRNHANQRLAPKSQLYSLGQGHWCCLCGILSGGSRAPPPRWRSAAGRSADSEAKEKVYWFNRANTYKTFLVVLERHTQVHLAYGLL